MIVDECDKYELPDITDTISFNFSTADSWVRSRIVSGREGGGGSLRGSGLNQTNSRNHCDFFKIIFVFYDPMQFYYTESQSTTSAFRSGI
jgi:hypothetical protein